MNVTCEFPIMAFLDLARTWIGLGPNDYVSCASAYTQTNIKHGSCDWLKPYLLLYDTIFVDEVGSLIYNGETSEISDTYQWLLDERLIDQYPRVIYREADNIEMSEETTALLKARDDVLNEPARHEEGDWQGWDQSAFRAVAARWEAAILSDLCETNASCLERSLFNVPGTKSSAVMRVIVNQFPVPLADVPFQDIIALRNEREFVAKRAPLRNWSRKLGELSDSAIRDEISTQLDDYRKYMDIHRIKYRSSVIETVLTTPLGILEDLLKLRIQGAVSRLFKISQARVALAEAEMKAPSRELGLFLHAGDRLRASKS